MSAALRLPLERPKDGHRHAQMHWNNCAAFVLNDRGVLVHRPRVVSVYHTWPDGTRRDHMHIGVHFYCGQTALGPRNLTFTNEPPENAIVCHRCELIAVAKELPASSFIAGRHVHIGGLRAYKLCCGETETSPSRRASP